jgi:hypothetical protein
VRHSLQRPEAAGAQGGRWAQESCR